MLLLLRPSACLAGFEKVSFGLPVKLMKGAMTVRIHAELIRSDGEMSWIECRLLSDLKNSKGEHFGEREHHKAIVRVVERREDLGPFLQSEVDSLPQLAHLLLVNWLNYPRSSIVDISMVLASNPMEGFCEVSVTKVCQVLMESLSCVISYHSLTSLL